MRINENRKINSLNNISINENYKWIGFDRVKKKNLTSNKWDNAYNCNKKIHNNINNRERYLRWLFKNCYKLRTTAAPS